MEDQDRDPNLQAPQESNTGKHINFLEVEEDNSSTTGDDDNDKTPTQKAWQELREENDSKKDD